MNKSGKDRGGSGGYSYVEDTIRGRIAGWMNEIINRENLKFDFVDEQIEIKYPDGRTHRFPDLVIWDKRGQKGACLIELKIPIGWSPYDFPLINDAQNKVINACPPIPYFATWNINEFVLWKTFDPDAHSFIDRRKGIYKVVTIKDLREIDRPDIEEKIKGFLLKFLKDLERIYFEKEELPKIPVDEFFIYSLRSIVDAFYFPISQAIYDLFNKDDEFRRKLTKWFVEQGWNRPSSYEDFYKVARQFLYLIIDKILFYNTLRIFHKELEPINVPEEVVNGKKIKEILQRYFKRAEDITGDYETIFSANFIENIPLPDELASNFRNFVNGFSRYDFSKIGVKDIGRIFDSLIPDTERHKLGQYFTRSDVVDLINGFCIRKGNEIVADFGCGAGTFLVRAYARIKHLIPHKTHSEILEQLWGVDIAKFPAHLSMINLAVRDLSCPENYPKILCKDFFELRLGDRFLLIPKYSIKKLDKGFIEEEFPLLDAVVGNPPYTRQEEMEDFVPNYKKKLIDAIKEDWGDIRIGKRAGIYVYFFIHALKFLKDKGRFGYITSNAWLDADYGKYLQEFLLKQTKIKAIITSKVERWFEEADVNTVITILERCKNEEERSKNIVKFIQLKAPLSAFIPSVNDENERMKYVDNLVKFIENTNTYYEDEKIKIYPKNQKDLWTEGYNFDKSDYIGSKWSKYLRAPKIFYEILEDNPFFVRFRELTKEIRYGLKTGAEEFFYLTKDKIKMFSIPSNYLKPILTSPQQSRTCLISDASMDNYILWTKKSKKSMATSVRRYIEWGEERGYHKRTSIKGRQPWYSFSDLKPWKIVIPRLFNDRFVIFYNDINAVIDDSFSEVNIDSKALVAYLNSTISVLFLELYGSVGLGQGALFLSSRDIKNLPVIDYRKLNTSHIKKIEKTFEKLTKREIGTIFEEINANSPEEISLDKVEPDRRELDRIIMEEILGLTEQQQLEIYRAVIDLVKSRIEKAKSVKRKKKYKGVDINALAEGILNEIRIDFKKLNFPDDYIKGIDCRKFKIPVGDVELGRDLHGFFVRIDEEKLRFKSEEEARYVYYCARNRKNICIMPKKKDDIKRILSEYSKVYNEFLKQLQRQLETNIPDLKIRKRVETEIWKKLRNV